jgi:hypothetical protein
VKSSTPLADLGNAKDADTLAAVLDGADERVNHLFNGHQTQPLGRLARGWKLLEEPIPSTYQGRKIVAFRPLARMNSSHSARTAT